MENDAKKQNKFGKVVNIFVSIISYTIVILCVIISIFALSSKSNNGIAQIGGKSLLTVKSESMTGIVNKGDLIIIKTIKYDDESKGFVDAKNNKIEFIENKTIATFYCDVDHDNQLDIVTHKYIGREGLNYKFQGTYIKDQDKGAELQIQYVSSNSIIGVYEGNRLQGVGTFIDFLQSSVGFFICFVFPIFLYVCYRGYKLIIAIKENKLENAIEAAKLTEEERAKEKERIRQEVLKEIENQKNSKED